MTLTAKDVAEITRLLEASNFDELYLEMDGLKLSLRRGAGEGAQPSAPLADNRASNAAASATPAGAAASNARASATPAGAAAASGAAPPHAPSSSLASNSAPVLSPPPSSDPDAVDVLAPLLGTFYRAPKPGAPPFVEVGSAVEEETIIGIIEVMKLMNTVRAGARGKVTQILGRDGALVEYGEILIRVGR